MTDQTARKFPRVPRPKPYKFEGPDVGHDGNRPLIVRVVDRQAQDGSSSTVERNKNDCRLCRLEHRGRINKLQLQAGHRLQDDQFLTGISSYPSTLAAWGATRGYNSGDALQVKLDAKDRLEAALLAASTRGRFLLVHVVLREMDVRTASKLLGEHVSAVVPLLCDALDALARHYNLAGSAPDRAAVRAWLHPFSAEV